MTRKCNICKNTKDLDQFVNDRSRALGKSYRCIKCDRERNRKYALSEKGLARNKEYKKTHRENVNKWLRKQYHANKHKYTAKMIVRYALRDGILKKEPCIRCEDPIVKAHHPNYAKPLEVVWFCQKHHSEEHRRLKERVESII